MPKPSLLFLFLVVVPFVACAISYKEEMRGPKIVVSASTVEQARNLAHYATTCSALVDKTLALDMESQSYVEIKEKEAGEQPSQNLFAVYFMADTSLQQFTFLAMRAFIRRRTADCFHRQSDNAPFTDFLAAALAFRRTVLMLNFSGIAINMDYEPAKIQFSEGFFPNAKKLCSTPASMETPCLFQLYCMHSEIMLQCFEKLQPERGVAIKKMLEMEAFGREIEESMDFVAGGMLPSGMSLQGWYERHAPMACRRDRTAEGSESIEAKVRNLESVPIVSAGNEGSVRFVVIEDVPKAFNDLKTDKTALRRRQAQFLELRNEAPPLLQPPIEAFAHALAMLADGNVKQFRKEMADARREMSAALARQRKMELALTQAENKYIPVYKKYAAQFEILDRFSGIKASMLPLEYNP